MNRRFSTKKIADPSSDIHQELLAKALPIKEFEAKYDVDLGKIGRDLQDEGEEEEDNFDMISFSGYSLKFAKCQPVQYFSERALEMGEHSPMITNDVVVLRLCPTSSCSSSTEYGCHYNYSEYAIELSDYIKIMLKFAATKRDYMCDYCDNCLAYGSGGNNDGNRQRRKLNDAQDEDADQDADQDEENEAEEEEEQDDQGDYDDNSNAAYDGDTYSQYACSSWDTYCGDYSTLCVQNGQNDGDDENGNNGGAYMSYEDYENYLYCSQVEINDYAYFVKPRCDGYQGTIKMGIFYDKYCNQYAGNEVNIGNAGIGFKESTFQDFYSSTCMDCSESDSPPYDAASTMCNRLHYTSAKCTDDMSYNLFGDGDGEDESSQCSFIESIRFGTYNEMGQLTGGSSDSSRKEQMTEAQTMILAVAVGLSCLFVIYAGYLHHAMTNLLIKSLSHRELLPPSRHQNYRSRNGPRRSGRQLKKMDEGEPDWDDHNSAEYA
mmetsp:Transcript_14544/g.18987  ORF Transcript_14544/g.18987 Transcript_14544/m.18987 type:complete len:490 (+) Transcript_14544:223-1692(+)